MLATICRVHSCSADGLLGLRSPAPASSAASAISGLAASAAPGSLPQCVKCPRRKLADKMRKMLAGEG